MNEHAASSVYPLQVEGDLGERLSRWLWLVKWWWPQKGMLTIGENFPKSQVSFLNLHSISWA